MTTEKRGGGMDKSELKYSSRVELLAHEINGDYLDARRFATPLLEQYDDEDREPVERQWISTRIFELGVNAAHAFYVLQPRGDTPKSLRDAELLRRDTAKRLKELKRIVRREWYRRNPGSEPYEAWRLIDPPGMSRRRDTFKLHRRYVPQALGGDRVPR